MTSSCTHWHIHFWNFLWNMSTQKRKLPSSSHFMFSLGLPECIHYSVFITSGFTVQKQEALQKRQAKSPVICLLIKERQLSPLFKVIHFKIHFTGHPCFHNQPLISFNTVRSLCLSLSFKGMVQTVCEAVYVYTGKKRRKKKKDATGHWWLSLQMTETRVPPKEYDGKLLFPYKEK